MRGEGGFPSPIRSGYAARFRRDIISRILPAPLPFAILFAASMLAGTPALAQTAGPVVEAEFMTDYRVRGLSWSDGKAAAQVYVEVPLATSIGVSAQATTLRDARRHGGAELGLDLAATYSGQSGLLNWYGSAVGHLFAGAEGELDYGELQAGIGGALGPADLTLSASYAPPQDAIGGSNFYARAEGRVGIWGTPFSLRGHVGHSSGNVDDPRMAARLRPAGSYTDWALGGEYTLAPMNFSLTYSDTDISRSDVTYREWGGDHGARLVAGANIRF